MSDNTTLNIMSGGDTISTDDLATLNGATISGQKVQRVKVGFGTDGALQDVADGVPLPVELHDDSGREVGSYGAPIITNSDISTVAGNSVTTVADGVQMQAISDEFGDPLKTTNGALNVNVGNTATIQPLLIPEKTTSGTMQKIGDQVIIDSTNTNQIVASFLSISIITASVQFQGQIDAVSNTWETMNYTAVDATGNLGNSPAQTAVSPANNSVYLIQTKGYARIRAVFTAYTSGSVYCTLRGTNTAWQPDIYMDNNDARTWNPGRAAPLHIAIPMAFNNASYDRVRSIINATNSTGTGITAVGTLAQLDDTTPTAITENQFGNMRMSANRALYVESRHATITTYIAADSARVPVATATDVYTIIGSASKTIFVHWIKLDCTQTTGGLNNWFVIKRSAADTGGTTTALTLVPLDSGNAAATAAVSVYTANAAALGTAVGNVDIRQVPSGTVTTTTPVTTFWNFNDLLGQPITLRGVAQTLALNFNGVAIPAGLAVNFTICWSEADG